MYIIFLEVFLTHNSFYWQHSLKTLLNFFEDFKQNFSWVSLVYDHISQRFGNFWPSSYSLSLNWLMWLSNSSSVPAVSSSSFYSSCVHLIVAVILMSIVWLLSNIYKALNFCFCFRLVLTSHKSVFKWWDDCRPLVEQPFKSPNLMKHKSCAT